MNNKANIVPMFGELTKKLEIEVSLETTEAEVQEALAWYQEYQTKSPQLAHAKEILEFLNRRSNKNFRAVEANLVQIQGRLKEGATMQDCKSVIAMMVRKWGGDEVMAPFLRPATLFNKTKFWSYHGELGGDE